MPAAQVMTVAGPLPAEELGATDAHEHLFLRSPALPGDELEDEERAVEEARDGADTGLRSLIELTPIGCGRRPDLLRAVSRATGLAIVAASGYHRDAHYPADHWVHAASLETLTERTVTDLRDGMHPADWDDPALALDPARAGVIKAGASHEQVTDSEHRRLLAAVEASRQTGAAVVVHTEAGTFGPQIVGLLLGAGLPAERLTLAHLDRNPDPALHADICSAGVSLVYDTIGRDKYGPDSERVELIARMVDGGHAERLMLGLDLGRRGYFRAYGGGPGLRHLLGDFVPRLRERIGAQAVETMLVRNPARAFALAPVRESVA
ncbi:MAG TPA: aryldialkylphosphatase [Candidatus Limnocylindria bacterium]|nr:aryldialkylphosphatase [Candidatus Limnocylindria bacterium]